MAETSGKGHGGGRSQGRPWWRRYRDSWGVGGLLVIAPACALVWFSWPRPLVPYQLPSLTLAAAPVRAVLEADAKLAAATPSSEAIEALDDNFLAQGRADDKLQETVARHRQRARARMDLLVEVRKKHGERGLLALRARAVARLEALLAGRLEAADAAGILGIFPNFLAQHGVTRDGLEVAPTFVVRTLYKARWNRLHGLSPAHGFTSIEDQAYFGWQALHASTLPVPARLVALDAYERAGGTGADEARGVLLFRNQEYAAAVQALTKAHAGHSSLRLRNYLLGAQLVAVAHGR